MTSTATNNLPNNLPQIGVLTVSDRASRGEYEDRGGPAAVEYLGETFTSEIEFCKQVIPDVQTEIEAAIIDIPFVTKCFLDSAKPCEQFRC